AIYGRLFDGSRSCAGGVRGVGQRAVSAREPRPCREKHPPARQWRGVQLARSARLRGHTAARQRPPFAATVSALLGSNRTRLSRALKPFAPCTQGRGVGVRGLGLLGKPLPPNPSPLSTGERGELLDRERTMPLPIPTNTTCDIYRTGHSPPAAPDVAGV